MFMYFAQLDNNNKVLQVIVADQDFINTQPGTWVQTDFNGVSPINYAGIGYVWNSTLNGFIPPQPFPSWILDNATCAWSAPVAYPTDSNQYGWDETSQTWVLVTH